MDLEQKFQQRWEYRRKDDEVDSSSDDSKSSLGNEPDQKKHKLVSNLNLPEKDDEAVDTLSSQQNNQVDGTKNVHFQIAEVAKHVKPGKKKIAVNNKLKTHSGKTRKRKVRNPIQDQEPAPLNDLKIFTESLLKDIKVAREKMFVRMKKEMTKLVAAKPVSRPRRNRCLKKSSGAMHLTGNKSGIKTRSCCGGLKKGSRKDNMGFDSQKCTEVYWERTNHEKAALESNRMAKRELSILPGNRTVHLVKGFNQIGSSYLTLPTVLLKPQTEPQTESLSIDPSLHNHTESVFPANNANSAERENSVIDENDHYSNLISIQPDEQFGSFVQINSKGMGIFDQQSNQISSVVSGLPVSLHPLPNSGFSITSQSALKNPAQENYTVGLRMNGGAVGFSGTSPTSSGCFVAHTVSRNTTDVTNKDTDGALVSFRYGEVERDHLAHI